MFTVFKSKFPKVLCVTLQLWPVNEEMYSKNLQHHVYVWNDINIHLFLIYWQFLLEFVLIIEMKNSDTHSHSSMPIFIHVNMLWRNVIHTDFFDLKQDKKIHIYSISDSNGALQELQTVDNTGEACDMMYSPDGEYLATAGADRYVRCFKLPNYEVRNNI